MSTHTSKQAVYLRTKRWPDINWSVVMRVFWFITSAAFLAWCLIQLQRPDVLPIKKIQALGTFDHVDEAALRSAVAVTGQAGHFSVNIDKVQSAVENLPWVAQASVSRIWPDTLAINVTEQQAYAVWAKGGVVNQHGVVFFPKQSTYPGALPVFDGPVGMERNMTEQYRLAKTIIAPLDLGIQKLSMDTRRAVSLQLSNGIQVILGRQDLQSRLERFVRVYKKVLASRANDIARIDMRYSNGLSVGWHKGKSAG